MVLWNQSLALQDEPPDAKCSLVWSQDDLFISAVKGEWSRSEFCSRAERLRVSAVCSVQTRAVCEDGGDGLSAPG